MPNTITLSKIESAKRQLEMSIKLFFMDQDLVSIHTLASASHQVLLDLAKRKKTKIQSFLFEKSLEYIKPEFHKEFISSLRKPGNYFKHADKDPNAQLEFSLYSSEGLIFDAVNLYGQLTDEYTSTMVSFNIWFYLSHPKIINEENVQFKSTVDYILQTGLDIKDKSLFIDGISEIEKFKNNKLRQDLIRAN